MTKFCLAGHWLLAISLVAGIIVWLIANIWIADAMAIQLGILTMGATFTFIALITLWPLDANATAKHIDKLRPSLEETLVVVSTLSALGSTIWLLVAHANSNTQLLGALAGLGTIGANWAMLHLMYGARYAHVYYSGNGDLDFHQDAKPTFVDFFYFSFAIGMSFAVSDTEVNSREFRSVIFRHAILSYVFGTVILAAMINLVASVLTSGN